MAMAVRMVVVVVVVVAVRVSVAMRVSVRLHRVDVCLEGVRMVVLVLGRRVRAILVARFIVSIQKVAARSSLPDMMAIRAGEGILRVGGSRRKERPKGVAVIVAVTMMVPCRVAAQREGIARSHGHPDGRFVVIGGGGGCSKEVCGPLSRHRGVASEVCLAVIAVYHANETSATSRH